MTFIDMSLLKSDTLPSFLIMKFGEAATFDLKTKKKMMFLWASRSAKEEPGTCRNENGVKNSRTILERSVSHIQHQADS